MASPPDETHVPPAPSPNPVSIPPDYSTVGIMTVCQVFALLLSTAGYPFAIFTSGFSLGIWAWLVVFLVTSAIPLAKRVPLGVVFVIVTILCATAVDLGEIQLTDLIRWLAAFAVAGVVVAKIAQLITSSFIVAPSTRFERPRVTVSGLLLLTAIVAVVIIPFRWPTTTPHLASEFILFVFGQITFIAFCVMSFVFQRVMLIRWAGALVVLPATVVMIWFDARLITRVDPSDHPIQFWVAVGITWSFSSIAAMWLGFGLMRASGYRLVHRLNRATFDAESAHAEESDDSVDK